MKKMKIKSVTQRVKNVSQPFGGYVPKKLFVHEKYEDYNKVIAVDRGVATI